MQWLKYILIIDIGYNREKTFSTLINPRSDWMLRFDYYIPTLRLVIEYDGSHHYRIISRKGISKKQIEEEFYEMIQRDEEKDKWCSKNNVNLLRIPYTVRISKIKQRITEYLATLEDHDTTTGPLIESPFREERQKIIAEYLNRKTT